MEADNRNRHGTFLSLLGDDEFWVNNSNIVLVQAVKTRCDLLYQPEIQQLKADYEQQFIHQGFVSTEAVARTLQGRIPAALKNHSPEQAAGITLSKERYRIMLCGNPGIIK